jgi:CotH protein
MKKRRSGLAVTSLTLGIIAMSCVMTGAPILRLVAVPLGVVTLVFGCVAAWKISRRSELWSGKGMAVSGIILGMLGSFLGVVTFSDAVMRSQQQWQHPNRQFPAERISHAAAMRNEPVANFTSNLPIIVLESEGDYVSHDDRTPVRAAFYDSKQGRASVSAKPDYDGFGTINLRGHSTKDWPKQSYTFHVTDERRQQIKAPLLGLPAEEDWVLYAPFEDKSLIRDVLAYELARRMGQYAPRTRYVELFLKTRSRGDGKLSMRHYMGVYVLVEKIKRGKERVNIAKLNPEDSDKSKISGGYIVKRDHSEGGGSHFRTERGGPFFYVYPKPREITQAQRAWIKRYFEAFEDALYGEDFADPRTGYAAYLDVDGFLDSHWLIELSKNVDGFRYSAYMTKDRGKKLKPGPAWDWNRAWGNANYYGGGSTKGWYWTVLRRNEISWHQRLRQDPAYVQRAAARWRELRKNVLDSKNIAALIDELAAQLEEPQKRNFQRWPILGEQVASNYYVGQSYREEVDWLKKWVEGRVRWIDGQVEAGKL